MSDTRLKPGGRARRPGTQVRAGFRRRKLLLGLVATGIVATGLATLRFAGRLKGTDRPRNVLLITMDTTRADYLGCYGAVSARTPNIDRLAREGTLFARCSTCSPLTLPSHSSILTGLYPYVHGARLNGTGRLAEVNITLAETLREAGYATQATVASFVLNKQFGTAQGFDVYHDVVPTAGGEPLMAERKGIEIGDDAIQMLRALSGRPFFLWVHFYDPHFPYESPRVDDILSPAAYADEITLMDSQIGRLLEELKRLGRDRDTLVVAVADHGEGLNQHEEWKHGYFLYQTTLHTALLMRCPGTIPAGKLISAQVRTIDIAPTILDLLGLPPWDHAQGVSLRPLITGQQPDPKLAAYGETFLAQVEYGLSQLRSLTLGGWKYIWSPKPELYDLVNDPQETENLAAREAERAARLHEQLRQLIAEAPPPPTVDQTTSSLTGQELARLESLGYVGGRGGQAVGGTELDRFEPRGGNPQDFARSFKLVSWEFPQLLKSGQHKRAEMLVRQLMETMPEAAYLPAYLGTVLLLQGRNREAEEAFQKAVSLAPDDYLVRMKYGGFLRKTERPADALAQFEAVLERYPDDVEALKQAALALATLGRLEAAEANLRRALEIEPRSAPVLRVLALIYEDQKRLPEALQYLDQALAIDPDFRECQEDRRRVGQKLGR